MLKEFCTSIFGALCLISSSLPTMAQAPLPTVYIDAPAQGSAVSGTVTVSGWAVDNASVVGTAISSVQVKVDGTVVGTATYGISRPDVCAVYPSRPGCPNVGYSYALNTSALSVGTHTITVTATDSDGTPDTGSSSVTVNVQTPPPTVYIDGPTQGSAVSGTVTVSGWAVDNASVVGTAISSVQVKVDGTVVGTATYGISRADVCAVYPGRPGCPNVGYSFSLNTSALSVGSHTIMVTATDSDGTPDAGSSSVTVNVQTPTPTVYIDGPAQGSAVSTIVTVSGWALDNASVVGSAISSVQVKVDGTVVGTATYGISRADVCAVYPGRPGCPNVGYSYSLNTSALSVGSHTIMVTATDSDGTPDTGSSSVTVNVQTPPPTVYIDGPAQGSAVSGTVTVSGWALDNASVVGSAISSVQVKVDGTVVGTPTYGISRADVCAVYPGRPGCPNVGYSYALNTSALSVGSHTITVTATDSDGTPDTGSSSVTVSSSGTITHVQQASNSDMTGKVYTSFSATFPGATTSSNAIVVGVSYGDVNPTITATDSQGNTYSKAVSTFDPVNDQECAILYATNAKGGTWNTVTLNFGGPVGYLGIGIHEYSGLAAASALDAAAGNQGTGTSLTSGTATTTANGDLIFSCGVDDSSGGGDTFTPGTGFTKRVDLGNAAGYADEDIIQATAGSIAATWKLAASRSWIVDMAAFKAAGGDSGAAPSITSLSPTSGALSTPVTITGTNFGSNQGASSVRFNGTAATPTSWSNTSIVVPVPSGATTGNVVVTVGGQTSNGVTFTVSAPSITVTMTPVRGGTTVTQPLSLTASVQNDSSNAGITWSASGGSLSNQTISSATFTATSAGVYTITATSKANGTKSASALIGVTDLSGVTTWRNDVARSGVNSQEYALTTQNVASSTFGKLFSCPVDGWVFAQPLWAANVLIGGVQHNVVFAATENDSLYAFDADATGCNRVWSTSKVSLIPSGEVVAPYADLENDNALGPVVGITGTPVIDLSSQTIYLVAMSENSSNHTVVQRLHAMDITTGQERPGSPVVISASIAGTGYDNSNGTISFKANMQKQRPALLLLDGVIYVSWAGFLDTDPYHGWMIGYSASTLAQVTVFNDTRDGGRGGIWMSGGGPAVDSQGNIFLFSGNGDFNANTTGGRNYGDTFLKLSTSGGLSVADWFTPYDQDTLAADDLDLGGGGAAILVDQTSGPFPHLVVGGGKGGTLYVVNRDNLGHYNSSNNSQIVQSFTLGSNGIYSTGLFWQDILYAAASGGPLSAFQFSTLADQFQTTPSSSSSESFSFPGTTPALSAAISSNGILWAIQRPSSSSAAAILHAYDATNLHTELWNSSQAASDRDKAGTTVKFTVPTIANGKVYIGTQTELDVFGLLPNGL